MRGGRCHEGSEKLQGNERLLSEDELERVNDGRGWPEGIGLGRDDRMLRVGEGMRMSCFEGG